MTDEMRTKAAELQAQLRAELPGWSIEVQPDVLLPDTEGEYTLTPVYVIMALNGVGTGLKGTGLKITMTRDFMDGVYGDPVALVLDKVRSSAT